LSALAFSAATGRFWVALGLREDCLKSALEAGLSREPSEVVPKPAKAETGLTASGL
jgi:hypothetical protein